MDMARRPSPADIDHAHASAQKVVETHRRLVDFLRVGQTLGQIDAFVANTFDEFGCKSCFKGYKVAHTPPFPSFACLSVNECIVHGTAGYLTKPMEAGDLLSIDIGVTHRGWIGDAAWTYVFEQGSDEAIRLMECGKESLRRGIEKLQPGGVYLDFGQAVQEHVESECGFYCVRGLVGHGYGRKLHAPPYVANHAPAYPGECPDSKTLIEPGTLVAVEPMIAVGTAQIAHRRGEWPIFTADGSLSVHYEHDVYISEDGPRVLTEGLDDLPNVIG